MSKYALLIILALSVVVSGCKSNVEKNNDLKQEKKDK